MSPDEIFAAQMWPWPDPVIKRDPMGRVLIVNAAFLQLYGGRVENWTGHPVQGWPAPNPQGLPHKFETQAGAGEYAITYDWLEVTMADGNALAIARDVTCYQNHPAAAPVPEYDQSFNHGHDNAPQVAAEPAYEPAPAPAAHTAEPEAAPAPQFTPPPAPVPVAELQDSTPQAQPAPQFDVPQVSAPELSVPDISLAPPAAQSVPQTAPTPTAAPVEPATPVQQAPEPIQETIQEIAPADAEEDNASREFERRALPIEDGDSVLGTNWRDAVIAKAVGADVPEETADEAPETAEVHAHETPEDSDPQIGDGLHILLAEDNAINALLTRTLLEAEGCIVDTVEDGALAVKAVEKTDYDLIFMDMRMPNMDGLEATRKIRAMGARTEKLPIIALTANAFDDDRNACFDSGMNDFMTKPVSAEELTEMVQNWAGKDTAQDEAA